MWTSRVPFGRLAFRWQKRWHSAQRLNSCIHFRDSLHPVHNMSLVLPTLGEKFGRWEKNRPLLNLTFWRHLGWWKFCYFRLRAWEKYILGNSAPLRPFLYKIGLNSAAVLFGRSTFYSALFWVILYGRTIGQLATATLHWVHYSCTHWPQPQVVSLPTESTLIQIFSPQLSTEVFSLFFLVPYAFVQLVIVQFRFWRMKNSSSLAEGSLNQRPPNGPVLLPPCSTVCSWHPTSPQNGHL